MTFLLKIDVHRDRANQLLEGIQITAEKDTHVAFWKGSLFPRCSMYD